MNDNIENDLWGILQFYKDCDDNEQNRKYFADAIIDYLEDMDWGFCPDCDGRKGEPISWTDLD